VEGKIRNGGLRVGEMEKDALGMHGAASIVRDRLFEQSDFFETYVCRICGHFAIYNPVTNIKSCTTCNLSGDRYIVPVEIPYGTKVVFQYLTGINMVPRIFVDSKNELLDKGKTKK
jgi:DNA-directed RNA polymerase beta subunit